jgi:hypothetical protein
VSCGIATRETSRHDGGFPDIVGKRLLMGDHVHVRLSQGLSVTDEDKLVEHSRCRCGATWAKTYRLDEGEPDHPA